MCLDLLDTSETIVAEKDMTFYKVVRCRINNIGDNIEEYYTPYRGFKITPCVTYVDGGCDFTDRFTKHDFLGRSIDSIEEGGFHLFVRMKDAELCAGSFINTNTWHFNTVTLVMKAIVPKGSVLINGRFGDYPSVCTKVVRYELIGNPRTVYYGIDKLPPPYENE